MFVSNKTIEEFKEGLDKTLLYLSSEIEMLQNKVKAMELSHNLVPIIAAIPKRGEVMQTLLKSKLNENLEIRVNDNSSYAYVVEISGDRENNLAWLRKTIGVTSETVMLFSDKPM